jgi:hypothetical protein
LRRKHGQWGVMRRQSIGPERRTALAQVPSTTTVHDPQDLARWALEVAAAELPTS